MTPIQANKGTISMRVVFKIAQKYPPGRVVRGLQKTLRNDSKCYIMPAYVLRF